MKEISEARAKKLAGKSRCPVVASEENEETDSAVALKKFPSCYVLGVSCDAMDRFKFYAFDDLDEARAKYDSFVDIMRRTGTPFGALC